MLAGKQLENSVYSCTNAALKGTELRWCTYAGHEAAVGWLGSHPCSGYHTQGKLSGRSLKRPVLVYIVDT